MLATSLPPIRIQAVSWMSSTPRTGPELP